MATALLLLAGSASSAERALSRYETAARRLFELADAGRYAEFDGLFDANMAKAFPLDKRKGLFENLREKNGALKSLGPARLVPPLYALVPARFERGVLDVKLVLDGQDRVTGLFFQPHAPPLPVPEKHLTTLRAPFHGAWLTFWGGDTREQNAHLGHPNQAGAFDFLGAGPDGKTRRGEGLANEDYYAFGRELLAPADGVVTDAVDGVRDNVPGSMNQYSALGNYVVVKHRDLEYSVLAHLKQGSVRVKAGDAVKSGQVLGQCGNSGNSSEPHLHYHLQNTPVIQDGTGIKVFFSGLEGKKAPYSPVKGDVIDAP